MIRSCSEPDRHSSSMLLTRPAWLLGRMTCEYEELDWSRVGVGMASFEASARIQCGWRYYVGFLESILVPAPPAPQVSGSAVE